jgi:hypothetical protein
MTHPLDTMTLKERLAFLASPEARKLSDGDFRDSAVLACADAVQVFTDLEQAMKADRDLGGLTGSPLYDSVEHAMRPVVVPLELL